MLLEMCVYLPCTSKLAAVLVPLTYADRLPALPWSRATEMSTALAGLRRVNSTYWPWAASFTAVRPLASDPREPRVRSGPIVVPLVAPDSASYSVNGTVAP